MLFERNRIADLARRMFEEHGICLGTSSWRYQGWCGLLYDEDRYLWGTHFSKKRFFDHCLEEYSTTFRSVCVDSTYYALPRKRFLEGIYSQVPDDFMISFKVPDDVTIRTFPKVEGFGERAGMANDFFLSPGLLEMGFLSRLEPYRSRVGVVVFEFSHFHPGEYEHGRDFMADLDRFLAQLPKGWRYAVEIRNGNWLHPDYFAMLSSHGVAHVYNQWTRMPPVLEQMIMHPPASNPFLVGRFLLTPGRSHERAREQFEPFHQLREIDLGARDALRRLISHQIARQESTPGAFLYVGNELEGNALHTISAVIETMVDQA